MSYLGTVLVEMGLLTDEGLQRALESQRETGKRLGEALIDLQLITDDQLVEGLAKQLNIRVFTAAMVAAIDPAALALVPESLARRHNLLAVAADADTITVAMSDPVNLVAIDDVTAVTQRVVRPLAGRERDISNAIDRMYEGAKASDVVDDALADLEVSAEPTDRIEDIDVSQLRNAADDAPIVRLVNSIVHKAIQERATDIHLEPLIASVVVRYRIDGMLYDALRPSKKLHAAIISRIKVLADLDIAERRVPQDGRFSVRMAKSKVDVRVSVCPTVHGEKVVMRLLDKGAVDMRLEKLGFSDQNYDLIQGTIHRPWGMFLVSGPTGSGKSTTLYSALNELSDNSSNIMTVEDPVEYVIERINQVPVSEKTGLTFARALRSFLRQDPDIIMVGEIRDKETAEIAVRAALTGHFVLSTIHANDAITTATRLIDMGVERYLVASGLTMVLAQRLVRRLCQECATPAIGDVENLLALGVDPEEARTMPSKSPAGCPSCKGRGYSGRVAIHEVLKVTPRLRELIASGAPTQALYGAAIADGFVTLTAAGVSLVRAGITSAEEVRRVALDHC